MAKIDPIDYSKTQRIVLLIDLYPLLHLQNPKSYLNSLLNSAKILLSFPPLSLSLSSFKIFFSSLSPHLSYSTLLNLSISSYNPNFISFNPPSETLDSLSRTLNLVLDLIDSSIPSSAPRASDASSSILQVIHDYSWDLSDYCDGDSNLLGVARSNLVVVFSPVCRSFKDLCKFMGVDEVLSDCAAFCDKFREIFGHVRDAFRTSNIHFCWVDVRYNNDIGNDDQSDNVDECNRLIGLFKNGFKRLGWSFCSSDSIILGSALVSFGLIYPMIGVSSAFCNSDNTNKGICGQLNLEILDVTGKPMECKYCELQLLDLKMSGGHKPNGLLLPGKHGKSGVGLLQQTDGIFENFEDGAVKIDLKTICRHDELVKINEQTSGVVLIHELPAYSKKKKEETSGEFFADIVLDLLSEEGSMFTKRNSPPLWQILLSFLYRNGYWALMNISNPNGSISIGVLKPFTVHSAFLYILKNNNDSHCGALNHESESKVKQCTSETYYEVSGFDIDMDLVNRARKNEIRKKNKKHPKRYKDLSWSSFCKAASQLCEMELEEAYFSKGFDTSKKLRFLKCWMKQVTKHGSALACRLGTPKNLEKAEERVLPLHERIQLALLSVAGKTALKEPIQSEEAKALQEVFFGNLSERIQHGIATGVDLLSFAQRVVCSCIYWLRQKLGQNTKDEGHASIEKSDGNNYERLVAGELIKLLLINPKDIAVKHKDGNLSSKEQIAQSSKNSLEDKVREYELQILFRMEILQSDIASGLRDSAKRRFVKDICCLLELIQCNMEDGFFGDFDFNDYLGRTIKIRYSQNLGDVVHRIYDQMDLLLFDDDDDQSPNPLLNSEDSSQSWKIGDSDRGSKPNSTDDSFHFGDTDHVRKLVEAQERRVKASRFSSSTRRAMPELQRVWAPKPPKVSMSKSNSFSRSKRKGRHKESHHMVCETPISVAKKCLFPADGIIDDKDYREVGGSLNVSVHRALFQGDS